MNGRSNAINTSFNSIISDNYPNLVITSTFRPNKRLFDAIELTNYLKNKYPKVKLNIVGKIDNITKDNINKIDCNNCIFYGVKDQDFMEDSIKILIWEYQPVILMLVLILLSKCCRVVCL